MIDRQNCSDQPVRNNLITVDRFRKIVTDQRHDFTTGCFLDYNHFKKSYYKTISIDLNKQQVLNADPKGIQQIDFTENLTKQATMSFIIEEVKETALDFSRKKGTVT